MIQESINQILGSAAVAGRFSPKYEERAERYSLKRGEKKLHDTALQAQNAARAEARQIRLETGKKPSAEHQAIQAENLAKTRENLAENLQKQFQLDPSIKSYKNMLHGQEAAKRYRGTADEKAAIAREEALKKIKNKINNGINQDNDFKKFRDSILLDANAKPIKVEVTDEQK